MLYESEDELAEAIVALADEWGVDPYELAAELEAEGGESEWEEVDPDWEQAFHNNVERLEKDVGRTLSVRETQEILDRCLDQDGAPDVKRAFKDVYPNGEPDNDELFDMAYQEAERGEEDDFADLPEGFQETAVELRARAQEREDEAEREKQAALDDPEVRADYIDHMMAGD